jgi:hypothetical protein
MNDSSAVLAALYEEDLREHAAVPEVNTPPAGDFSRLQLSSRKSTYCSPATPLSSL